MTNPSLGMKATIRGIRMKFPSVKTITTETLQNWLGEGGASLPAAVTVDNKNSKLILLDTRPEEEYTIGHIAKSIRVDHEMDDMELLKKLMLQDTRCDSPEQVASIVVMYCSVGYRSSSLAEKLLRAIKPDPAYKYWQVFNLEGSIFKWANENRPIVDQQGQPTIHVHPFNNFWES